MAQANEQNARRRRSEAEQEATADSRTSVEEQVAALRVIASQLGNITEQFVKASQRIERNAGKLDKLDALGQVGKHVQRLTAATRDVDQTRHDLTKMDDPTIKTTARHDVQVAAATSVFTVALLFASFWFFGAPPTSSQATGAAMTSAQAQPKEATQWEDRHIDPTVSNFNFSERQVWDEQCATLRNSGRSAERWRTRCIPMLERQWRDDHQ